MCQTRVHDGYIDYLQGLANEDYERSQRQAVIEKALALPLGDRMVLWQKLSQEFIPASQWRQINDEANAQWEIDNLAIIEQPT